MSSHNCQPAPIVKGVSTDACLTDACTRRENMKHLVEQYRSRFQKNNVLEEMGEQHHATHGIAKTPLDSLLVPPQLPSCGSTGLVPKLPPPPSSLRASQINAFSNLSFLVFQPLLSPRFFGAVPVVPRALLFGPSGCGKTFLLRRLAEAYRGQALVVRVELSALYDGYVGETESNLRKLFERVEEMSKAKTTGGSCRKSVVLVLEGVDRIARRRSCRRQWDEPTIGRTREEDNSTDTKLLTTLLLCLDAVDSQSTPSPALSSTHGDCGRVRNKQGLSKLQCYDDPTVVFGVIATSRLHPEDMEESLLRPGRVERWIGVD
eukprot:GHVS01101863.1.p1 GENE.GHVS01101863.1~~GHVS01101863.1.p1  ORF type:complete len:319 (+),score=41.45 GHVS01101863.1:196-1152(+)